MAQQQEGGRNCSLSIQNENQGCELIHVSQNHHVEIIPTHSQSMTLQSMTPQSMTPWSMTTWFCLPNLMRFSKLKQFSTQSRPISSSSPAIPVPQPTSQPMGAQSTSTNTHHTNTSIILPTSTQLLNTSARPFTLNDQLASSSTRLASAQRMSTSVQSSTNSSIWIGSANAQLESAQDQISHLLALGVDSPEITRLRSVLFDRLTRFNSNRQEIHNWTKEECIQAGIVFDCVKVSEGRFCPILQDTLAEGQPVAFWPTCHHSFDPDSLVAYLGKTCNPPTCPMCRIPLNMNDSKTDDCVAVSSTSTTPSINTFQNQDAQSSSETSSSASVPSTSWYNTTLTRPMVVNSSTHPRASQQQQQQPVPSNRQAQRRQCCVVL